MIGIKAIPGLASISKDEPLTQMEIERLMRLALDAKNGRATLVTIMPSTKNGGLFIKPYRNAV